MDTAPRRIEGSTSLVLDSLRLLAALTVLYRHIEDVWFPATAHVAQLPGDLSHAAVIVFFVLSGFVIAYTTSEKQRGLSSYMQARFSRLCSMVIPALLLTAVVEIVVRVLANPDLIANYVRGTFGPRYVVTALFLNEIWFFSAAPPVNRPLWSLGFEFWYYVIFGLWYCTGRGLKSWALALGACLVAGPKIVLMMPIWLMGCAAYHLPRPQFGRGLSWLCVALALAAAACTVLYLPPFPYALGEKPLFFANQFASDWVAGVFVALALWLLPPPAPAAAVLASPRVARNLRVLADLTFPIYVLHHALLVLYLAVFGLKVNDASQFWQAVVVILVVSSLLGLVLEWQRPNWSRFFRWLFAAVQPRLRKAFAR